MTDHCRNCDEPIGPEGRRRSSRDHHLCVVCGAQELLEEI